MEFIESQTQTQPYQSGADRITVTSASADPMCERRRVQIKPPRVQTSVLRVFSGWSDRETASAFLAACGAQARSACRAIPRIIHLPLSGGDVRRRPRASDMLTGSTKPTFENPSCHAATFLSENSASCGLTPSNADSPLVAVCVRAHDR
jgi:hypothetical protein